MQAPRRAIRWGTGGVMMMLLLVVYFGLWRPVRGWTAQHAVRPVLEQVAERSGAAYTVRALGPRHVLIKPTPATRAAQEATYEAPAGLQFLLPALLLVGLFPGRAYWVYLWLGHLLLNGLGLAMLTAGMIYGSIGFGLYDLLQRYILDAFSLGFPMLVIIQRAGWAGLFEGDAPSRGSEPAQMRS